MSAVPHAVIAIPVYNGARYLASAVRSVLDQRYLRLSLYLLDDGSLDDPLHAISDIPASVSAIAFGFLRKSVGTYLFNRLDSYG